MSYYFSASKNAFFSDLLKSKYGSAWPSDAVKVSDTTHQTYTSKPPSGKVLGATGAGAPTWVAAPTPTLSEAQAFQSLSIKATCAAAIAAAFQFTAGAQTYTASLSTEDQSNLARNSTITLGVAAKSMAWAAGATVQARGICLDGGEYYISMAGGKTGTTKPTWPTAFGAPVTDGTAQWELFGLQVDTTVGRIRVTYTEFTTLFEQFSEFMDTTLGKCTALLNEIADATTVTAVQAVTW